MSVDVVKIKCKIEYPSLVGTQAGRVRWSLPASKRSIDNDNYHDGNHFTERDNTYSNGRQQATPLLLIRRAFCLFVEHHVHGSAITVVAFIMGHTVDL